LRFDAYFNFLELILRAINSTFCSKASMNQKILQNQNIASISQEIKLDFSQRLSLKFET
jgi:hypothetical protein